MLFRAKALLCAMTCLAAILVAATFAEAVDQTAKQGCTSRDTYVGSITSPSFTPTSPDVAPPAMTFQGWFEVESVAPNGHDETYVEYSTDPGPGQERNWILMGRLIEQAQQPPDPGGAPDQPYSNFGNNQPPVFQSFVYSLEDVQDVPGVQVRIRFATEDTIYQGFRGVGIDDINIDTLPAEENIDQTFEFGTTWSFDPASGPGAPFWQVLDNPQTVSVANPAVNPDLVTLPDSGALPVPPDTGTHVAWFGNTASGTFCGPDFANRDQAPDTTITSGPAASTPSTDASFSFTSSEGAALFECQLDGGGFTPCGSPHSYTGLSRALHNFEVRATDFTGNVDATPATYAWTVRAKTLDDLTDPQQGVSVNVATVSGTVLLGVKGTAARSGSAGGLGQSSQKGISFIPLSEASQVPVGSFLDTRKGTVRLQSARDLRGTRQAGTFFKSLFQVRQSRKRSAKGLTDVVLKGSSFNRCRSVRRGKGASAAGVSRRTIRRLRSNANGRFRTRGRNSSATVRGTIWDIADRCDGTLTKVKRGRVVVRDFRRKKNITLRAGKSYLARAPR